MNSVSHIALALALALSVPTGAQEISDEAALHQSAKNLSYREETRAQAIKKYELLVEKYPEAPQYRIELAQLLVDSKQWNAAEKLLEGVVGSDTLPIRAQISAAKGDKKGAYHLYRSLCESTGEFQSCVGYARASREAGDLTTAKAAYQKVAEDPSAPPSIVAEATSTLYGLQEKALAKQLTIRALSRHHGHPALHRIAGLYEIWSGRDSEGLAHLEPLFSKTRPDKEVSAAMALAYSRTKNTPKLTSLLKGKAATERDVLILSAVSELSKRGEVDAAEALLRDLKLDSSSAPEDRIVYARALTLLGNGYLAEHVLLEISGIEEATELLVNLYVDEERYADAVSTGSSLSCEHASGYAAALKRLSLDSKLDALKARCKTAAFSPHALTQGITLLRPSSEVTSSKRSSLSTEQKAWESLNDGRYEEASQHFELLLSEYPESITYLEGYARSLIPQKRFGEARDHLKVLKRLSPHHRNALVMLAKLYTADREFDKASEIYGRLIAANGDDGVVVYDQLQIHLWQHEFKEFDTRLQKTSQGVLTSAQREKLLTERALYAGDVNTAALHATKSDDPVLAAQVACAQGDFQKAGSLIDGVATTTDSTELRALQSRINAQTGDKISAGATYWSESGRGGTSDVTRLTLPDISAESSLDANNRLAAELSHINETFDFGPSLRSHELTGRFSHRLSSEWSFSALGSIQDYEETTIGARNSGELAVSYRGLPAWVFGLRAGTFAERTNYIAIRDDIKSDRYELSADWNIDRASRLGAEAAYLSYSDDNQGWYSLINYEHKLKSDGLIPSFISSIEYRDTKNVTTTFSGGTFDAPAKHPYWTPDAYLAGWAGFKLRQNWDEDLACGRGDFSEFTIRAKTDSDSNPSLEASLLYQENLSASWRFDVKALAHYSSDWEAYLASVGFQYSLDAP